MLTLISAWPALGLCAVTTYLHRSRTLVNDGISERIANRYPTIAGQRTNNFDTLRLLLAVLVIYSHSYCVVYGMDTLREPLRGFAKPHLAPGDDLILGALAVWSFFAISGFLITRSWISSKSILSYLHKRVGRIYPGFIVAALFCLLVAWFVTPPELRRLPTIYSFIANTLSLHLFAAPSVFARNPAAEDLNSSMWSIPYEFLCYIGVALLGILGIYRHPRLRNVVVAALFLGAVLARMFMNATNYQAPYHPIYRFAGVPSLWVGVLPFFLAGMVVAFYADRIRIVPWFAMAGFVLCGLSILVPNGPEVTLPTFGVYALFCVAYAKWLNPIRLGAWGDFSYGTYLYAWPIQQLLVWKFGPGIGVWRVFLISTPLSVLMGAASHYLVEKWFHRRRTTRNADTVRPAEIDAVTATG